MKRHFSAFRDNYLAAILSAVVILLSVCAQAQRQYQLYPSPGQWKWQKTDSTLHIPFGSTPSLRGGDNRPGALFLRVNGSDTTLLVWTGAGWKETGIGGSFTGDTIRVAKLDSNFFQSIPVLIDSTDPDNPVYLDSLTDPQSSVLLAYDYYVKTRIGGLYKAWPLTMQFLFDAVNTNGSGINKDNRINFNGFKHLWDSIQGFTVSAKALADTALKVGFGSNVVFAVTRNNGIQVGGATILKTEGNTSVLYGSNTQGMQIMSNGVIYIRGNSSGTYPAFTAIKKDVLIASPNSDLEGLYISSSAIWTLDKPGSRRLTIGARERGYTMYDSNFIFKVLDSVGFKVGGWTVDPAFGTNGMIIYRTDLNKFRVYQNGAWIDMVGSSDLTPTVAVAGSNFTISEPSDHRQKTYMVFPSGSSITATAPASPTDGQIITFVIHHFGSGSLTVPTFDGTETLTASGSSITLQYQAFLGGYAVLSKTGTSGGTGGLSGGNLGSAFRLYNPPTQGMKTISVQAPLQADSVTTGQINLKADTTTLATGLATMARAQFKLDSIQARKTPLAATSASSMTLTYSTGQNYYWTSAHSTNTVTASGFPDGEVLTIEWTNDSDGGNTLILPGGATAVVDPAANAMTFLVGRKRGSTWVWGSSYQAASTTTGGRETFTATAGQTSFTTTGTLPAAAYKVKVYRLGVKIPFTHSGNTVTTSACTDGDAIEIEWIN